MWRSLQWGEVSSRACFVFHLYDVFTAIVYMFHCVHARARACVCLRACMPTCVRANVCCVCVVCVRVCVWVGGGGWQGERVCTGAGLRHRQRAKERDGERAEERDRESETERETERVRQREMAAVRKADL